MTPLLLILSAPSGAGKTTLARRVVAAHPGAVFSVSYTTRPPRGAEQDGVEYHFISEERFQEMIDAHAFLEWARVHGHHYATPRRVLASGAPSIVFDIDVQGGESIKKQHPEAVRALLLPPSLAELERRLRARSTDPDDAIRRRLRAAQMEIRLALSVGYEYQVVNDDLDRACGDLAAIVRAEGCRAGRRPLAPDFGLP